MGVQMNIKSAEAKALAEKIAKAKGLSVTQAVIESLRSAEIRLEEMDRERKMDHFLAESKRLNAGREREEDPFAFLYDDQGLPK